METPTTTIEEYVARIEVMSDDALKTELNSVHNDLAVYRGALGRNEHNGYGDTENAQQQRRIIDTLNQKTQLIVQLQQRRNDATV